MQVSFSMGLENSGTKVTETVRVIGAEDLKQILCGLVVAGRGELLKLHNMTFKSPSTWWSIVRHGGKDVEATIRSLLSSDDLEKKVSCTRHSLPLSSVPR